ncbi:tetratricopeptide repeat protein [Marinifilum fragile]|uniref:tetratricopeptide repeat protein n=1 Tax=Marinifilum fragile TaxID=570161 RepID=UPI0006D23BA0|nr:tetratricopeptide repeat protein [Marinifilum fragile]
MKKSTIFFLVILMVNVSFAQKKYSIKSRRAIHFYEEAGQYYRNRDNQKTLESLSKALEVNDKFIEAYLFQADVYYTLQNREAEIEAYQKAIEIDGSYFPRVHLNLGNAYLKQGKYQEAKSKFEDFLCFSKISSRNKAKAQKLIKNCDFAMNMIANPVDFKP